MKSSSSLLALVLHLTLFFFFDGARAQSIAVGNMFACAILQGGVLKCWGYNKFAQLGLGDTANRGDGANEMGSNLPAVNLGTGRTAKKVFAGESHACAVLDNDKVKCWGRNDVGQLGIGDTSLGFNRGDTASEMGNGLPYVDLGTSSTVKTMCLGFKHTCAVMESGDVKCWGDNQYAQLGIDSKVVKKISPATALIGSTTATAIGCGSYHTCAIIASGAVKCWGRNNFGQLGAHWAPTALRGDAPGETASSDTLVGRANGLGAGRTAKSITVGRYHACAVLDDNTVKCWGKNEFGQLGQGNTQNYGGYAAAEDMSNVDPVDLGTGYTPLLAYINHASPIACGSEHTCILRNDGIFKCYGRALYGALGYGGTLDKGDSGTTELGDIYLTKIGTGLKAVEVASYDSSTCALLEDKTVKCWGKGLNGGLGSGSTSDNNGDTSNGNTIPEVDLGGTPQMPKCMCMASLGFQWQGIYE